MVPLAAIGMGSMIGGQVLGGIGEYQAARAMRDAGRRNLEDERRFNQQRQRAFNDELTYREANPAPDRERIDAGSRVRSGLRAIAPAATAGAQSLNLTGADASRAVSAVQPGILTNALTDAASARREDDAGRMVDLSNTMSDIEERRRINQALGQQRMALAGQRGGLWRALGSGISNVGSLATIAAMSQAPGAPVDGTTGASVAGPGWEGQGPGISGASTPYLPEYQGYAFGPGASSPFVMR